MEDNSGFVNRIGRIKAIAEQQGSSSTSSSSFATKHHHNHHQADAINSKKKRASFSPKVMSLILILWVISIYFLQGLMYFENNRESSLELDAVRADFYKDDDANIFISSQIALSVHENIAGRKDNDNHQSQTKLIPVHHKEHLNTIYDRSKSCLSNMSDGWLQGRRYNNIPANLSHSVFPIQGPLLSSENLENLLTQQNLCQSNCPFRNLENSHDDNYTYHHHNAYEYTVHIWKIRLIYTSLYYHQHRFAIKEGIERERLWFEGEDQCDNDMKACNVGSFDFECKESKFLIAEVRSVGIGSLLKWDMVNMMMAALAMNRTLVLYNNIEINGTVFSQPWKLSSCSRRDFQCSFQPFTACSLLIDDIVNATEVKFEEFRDFLYSRNSKDEAPYQHERVIRFHNRAPIPATFRALEAIKDIASNLIDELDSNDKRLPMLRKAASEILNDTKHAHKGEKFLLSESDFVHAFILYALRPIISKGKELESFLMQDIPADFNSTNTLGLPLRGSDKCHQESECLQPQTYMKLLGTIWSERGIGDSFGNDNVAANILVTSEELKLVDKIHEIAANKTYLQKLSFKPRLITNTNDIHQQNGNVNRPRLKKGVEADDIVTSILSSFKLQMNAVYTVGNCCSNFHQIIFHLLRGGCGVEPDNRGTCLQARNESIYQLCCDKGQSPACPKHRLERLAVEYNKSSISVEEVEIKIWED